MHRGHQLTCLDDNLEEQTIWPAGESKEMMTNKPNENINGGLNALQPQRA